MRSTTRLPRSSTPTTTSRFRGSGAPANTLQRTAHAGTCTSRTFSPNTAVLQPSGADRLMHAPRVCSGCQIEEMVDELDLSRQIVSCHPSNLPLTYHVDCFVALNGSPGRLEFSESLFGIHSTFDGSMILFEDVIQVLHGSVSTTIAQRIRQRDSSPPSQVADHFCACLQTEILVFS